MQLIYFSLADLLIAAVLTLPYFFIAKILSAERKIAAKEIVYFATASLIIAVFVNLRGRLFLFSISEFVTASALFLYFYKIKSKAPMPSLILASFSFFIGLLVEVPIAYAFLYFFPALYGFRAPLELAGYTLLIFTTSVFATLLLKKVFAGFFAQFSSPGRLQIALTFVCALLLLLYHIVLNVQYSSGSPLSLLSLGSAFVISYSAIVLICVFFYAKFLKEQSALTEKENEQKHLQFYLEQIEKQQVTMRKFKHDYQNILVSMGGFLDSGDISGLRNYYREKVIPASHIITNNNNMLSRLCNIKMPEIKSILISKLTLAQNLDIDISIEIVDEICHIPCDSVALVRMLGIILDNAIEEVAALKENDADCLEKPDLLAHNAYSIAFSCFKLGDSFSFVVQNTCRADIQNYHELSRPGFSTKGTGRGLGLSNLVELTNSQPNTFLQTVIENGSFTQILNIDGK